MVSALTTPTLGVNPSMSSGICRLDVARQPRHEVSRNPFRGVAIPHFGDSSSFATASQNVANLLRREHPVPADECVGPLLDRDWTFGILAHRETRHAERSRLFLNPAGIGN